MASTFEGVVSAIASACVRANDDLRADRLVLADRAAPWSLTHRAYRLHLPGFSLAKWYRDRPGTVVRIEEEAQILLSHAIGGDQSETRRLARSDVQRLIAGLLDDDTLRATGIRLEIEGALFSVGPDGGILETTVDLRLGYDLSIDSSEVVL